MVNKMARVHILEKMELYVRLPGKMAKKYPNDQLVTYIIYNSTINIHSFTFLRVLSSICLLSSFNSLFSSFICLLS